MGPHDPRIRRPRSNGGGLISRSTFDFHFAMLAKHRSARRVELAKGMCPTALPELIDGLGAVGEPLQLCELLVAPLIDLQLPFLLPGLLPLLFRCEGRGEPVAFALKPVALALHPLALTAPLRPLVPAQSHGQIKAIGFRRRCLGQPPPAINSLPDGDALPVRKGERGAVEGPRALVWRGCEWRRLQPGAQLPAGRAARVIHVRRAPQPLASQSGEVQKELIERSHRGHKVQLGENRAVELLVHPTAEGCAFVHHAASLQLRRGTLG
mmetsp:Transcript_29791/g.96172  ORF Transcript_29791/g.96172 Transcript_29791/m.96172 type:complete len:267 (-) Transcript_29791:248-1048(-)|eukprot:scaffold3574_cov121-Isochrysis_galbana.AAC.8